MALSTHKGPRWLDPHQAEKVRPATILLYQKAAKGFCRWMDDYGHVPMSEEDRESFMVEYKNSMNLTHSQFLLLVCAAEFFFPRFRGKL